MKKYLFALIISFTLFITGCGVNKTKEIEGIKLDKKYTTYGFIINPTSTDKEGSRVILRYDKSGNLKYLEYNYVYDIDLEEDYSQYDLKNKSDEELKKILETEGKCSRIKKLSFKDYNIVCDVNKRKAYIGISITDKTISDGLFDTRDGSIFESSITRNLYENSTTEEKVKELLNGSEIRETLKRKNATLIMADKKVNLN